MRVTVHGDRDRRVAEVHLNRFRIGAGRDQQAGAGVGIPVIYFTPFNRARLNELDEGVRGAMPRAQFVDGIRRGWVRWQGGRDLLPTPDVDWV